MKSVRSRCRTVATRHGRRRLPPAGRFHVGRAAGAGRWPATSSASTRCGSWTTSIRRPCRRCRRSRRGRPPRRWPARPSACGSGISSCATASAIRRCSRRWRSRSTTPAAGASSSASAAARTRRSSPSSAFRSRPPRERAARSARRSKWCAVCSRRPRASFDGALLPAARRAQSAAAGAAPASADPRRRRRRATDAAAGRRATPTSGTARPTRSPSCRGRSTCCTADCRAIGRDPATLRVTEEAVLALVERRDQIDAARALAERRFAGPGWGFAAGGYCGTPDDIVARLRERRQARRERRRLLPPRPRRAGDAAAVGARGDSGGGVIPRLRRSAGLQTRSASAARRSALILSRIAGDRFAAFSAALRRGEPGSARRALRPHPAHASYPSFSFRNSRTSPINARSRARPARCDRSRAGRPRRSRGDAARRRR